MKIFENVILRETTNNLDKPTNTKLSLMSSILTPHRRAPPSSADMNVSKGMGRKKGGRVLLLRWKPNPPHELSQYRPILPTSQTQHHVTVACIMQTVGWRNASYHRVILANSLQPFSGMFLPPLDGCQLFTTKKTLWYGAWSAGCFCPAHAQWPRSILEAVGRERANGGGADMSHRGVLGSAEKPRGEASGPLL